VVRLVVAKECTLRGSHHQELELADLVLQGVKEDIPAAEAVVRLLSLPIEALTRQKRSPIIVASLYHARAALCTELGGSTLSGSLVAH
jgi:hypothetical protein